ncbi:MAG: G5 domain-containing protein, partial [Finegoldia magna]
MKINKKLLMAALASAVIVSAPQVKTYTLSNAESVATNTGIGLSEEKPQAAVRASQEATDPNYLKDEKNVGFYKETQLERGNGPAFSIPNEPSMDYLDGFRYTTLEPSATSKSKTLWGIEMEFDREQGQRTYTNFGFTNSGLMGAYLDTGVISANDLGVKVAEDEGFKEANYKAESEINITASRAQRNLNLYSTVEDLAHINNIENKNTTIGWKSDYSKDASSQKLKATQGTGNVTFDFTVNPWPNENNQLDLIYLNGDYGKKEFVQGQTIETGIKVENLDDNARERLVGQVYHPVSGEVVPGAEAYIDKNDMVVVKMPDGVIDENGNLNTDSIFYKDPNYVAQQNLKVKFFARPRTEAEFRAVGVEANYGEDKYTSTGDGTEVINHKGKKVTIDKQGIPRYDHYNLIGEFDINLDDTRYYDQGFLDKNKKDTSKHTHSKVKPGEEFEVNLYVPEDKKNKDVFPYQKTPEEMEAAKSEKQAIGTIDTSFLDKQNEGKKPEDQWKLEYDESTLPTTFKITPPKSAKAGDFVAVPLTYTYTNGSTDVHWFHFVVQESTNNRPDYFVQVDYPSEEQKSTPKLPENPDDKKLEPKRYTIPDGTEFKDDKGNEWTVSIDETTGEVTAKPNDPSKFDGGETLTVPVVAHYKDPNEPDKDITEETKAEFVIKERANMTPRYNAKAGKSGDELSSEVILDKNDKFNRKPSKYTLDSNTFVDDKGNTWNVTIDENTGRVTATVPNAEEGQSIDGALLNVPVKAHYYENDGTEIATKEVEVQFVASGTEEKVEKILEVPFETKVEKDPNLKKGEIKVITEGEKGSKKVTYTIKDSKITDTKEEELKAPQDRLIHVGEGTEDGEHKIEEKVEVPYEVEIQFDDTLKLGEQVVFQEGEPGEKTRTTTITIQDGNVTNTQVGEYTQTKAPKKKIIKVGANTEGKVEHVEPIPFKYDVQYDPDFYTKYPEATDNYKIVTEGEAGERTTTWTIKNSEIVGKPEVNVTKQPVDAVIKVGKKDYNGTFTTKETKAVEFDTEYRVNNELKPGEVKVVQKGELGEEQVTVTHTIENGKVINSEKGQPERTKEPVKRIVEVGPGTTDGTHTYTNKKPFEVEVRVNPKLPKGEYNIIQKGVEGEEEYTITIENSKVTNTSEPKQIKAPVKEIIEVGNADFTGTIEYIDKDPIPFETEVTVDPSLKPGEIVEDQKGELGEQETKVTRKITNGEAGDPSYSKTTVTKEPVKRKIRVGSKTDGQYKETETIPFEVEVRKDPTLKKGEWKYAEVDGVQQTGESGLKERTITIVNSQVTETSEFITTREPKNAVILVGDDSTEGEVKHTEEIPFKYQVEESEDLKP